MIALITVAIGFAIILVGDLLEAVFPSGDPQNNIPGEFISGAVVFWLLIVVPPLATALFVCRIARRNSANWRWVIGHVRSWRLYCSSLFVTWNLPANGRSAQQAQMAIGIMFLAPFSAIEWQMVVFRVIPQFVLAMIIGFLLIKRAQRLQKIDEIREETIALRRAA